MLIILFSSSSFGDNISDKLRRISLQNRFSLSDKLSKPSFLSIISYLLHIFLYNLEVKLSMGTQSQDQEVLKPRHFQCLTERFNMWNFNPPPPTSSQLLITFVLILSGFPSHKNLYVLYFFHILSRMVWQYCENLHQKQDG